MSQHIDRDRGALAGHVHRYGSDDDRAAMPENAAGFHPAPSTMPMILDTDIGGDPDDAIALVIASQLPELQLVITTDEHRGRRARLARYLLGLLGRTDVPVIPGRDLGNTRYWAIPDRVVPYEPTTADAESIDPIEATAEYIDQADTSVRWVGIGPASNLADLLTRRPDLAERLDITQMGGGFPHRHTDKAEHNIRLDIPAFATLLAAARRPWLVPSDVTFHPDNEITPDTPEYQLLTRPNGPTWVPLLRTHLDTWFEQFHPGTMQHDAITLATAMRMPFVDIDRVHITIDQRGHTHTTGTSSIHSDAQTVADAYLIRRIDHTAFRAWLQQRLTKQN